MSIAEFLAQPLILAAGALGVTGVAAAAYIMRKGGATPNISAGSRKKKYVTLLRPKDHRKKEITIVDESDESLQGPKEKNGRTRYFVKRGPGWADEDKPQTMWLGMNAYAYTLRIKTIIEGKDEEGKQTIKPLQEVINLAHAVRLVLGEKIYASIPKDLGQRLETADLGITVEPENPALETGLSTGNEARHTESDEKMIDYYADKNAKAMQGNKIQWPILIAGLMGGIVLGIILVSAKVINLG